jgi:hypothetical protein
MTRVATVLIESLVEHSEDRLVLGGAANLTRNAADFPGSLRERPVRSLRAEQHAVRHRVVVQGLTPMRSRTSNNSAPGVPERRTRTCR